MVKIARVLVPVVAAVAVLVPASAASARPVLDDDRAVCAAGYHLTGATCFVNGGATLYRVREGSRGSKSFGGTF
jgi:hypothetical protein